MPRAVEKVPAAHVAQADAPVVGWKVPAVQLEHDVAPALEYAPAAQL